MPGKLCLGWTDTTHPLRSVRSYEDAVHARMTGGNITNPHPVGSDEAQYWDQGISDAVGGTIWPCSCYTGQTAPVQGQVTQDQYEQRMAGRGYDVARTPTGQTLFNRPDWPSSAPFKLSWAQIISGNVEQYLPADLVEPYRSQFITDSNASLTG